MKAVILPGKLCGKIMPPPSSAQAHCLFIAAALSSGTSRISGLSLAEDIQATLHAIQALGAVCTQEHTGDSITASITGTHPGPTGSLPVVDCRSSVDTLRLLLPLAIVLRGGGIFLGQHRTLHAELSPYHALFKEKNIECTLSNGSLVVKGTFRHGTYRIRGDVSAQFAAGLLLALPLLRGLSNICLTSALESREPVDIALEALLAHGIEVQRHNWSRFVIPSEQQYSARDSRVEGGYGLASFFYAAQGMGNALDIRGLDARSSRKDGAIRRISARLCDPGIAYIDASQCLDLVPAIAAQAALREGETTHIINLGRLRTCEEDQLSATARELRALGAHIAEFPEHLVIHGLAALPGGDARSYNKPLIAMMLAVAATCATNPVSIADAECVNRLYPEFWNEFARLGGMVQLKA